MCRSSIPLHTMSLAHIVIFMIAVLTHGRQGEKELLFSFSVTSNELYFAFFSCVCLKFSRMDSSFGLSLAASGITREA